MSETIANAVAGLERQRQSRLNAWESFGNQVMRFWNKLEREALWNSDEFYGEYLEHVCVAGVNIWPVFNSQDWIEFTLEEADADIIMLLFKNKQQGEIAHKGHRYQWVIGDLEGWTVQEYSAEGYRSYLKLGRTFQIART